MGVLLLVGVALTGSRAGAILLGLAGIGCAAMLAFYSREGRASVLKYVAVGVLAVALVGGAGAWLAAPRFAHASEDPRFTIWQRSQELVVAYFPTGSGGGSFASVYETIEPVSDVRPGFVNQAHNDLLELLVEFGVPGGFFLVACLVWLLMQFRRLGDGARLMSAAAGFALTLALAHSLVDYPLRTIGLAAVLAISAGLLATKEERLMARSL